MRRGGEGLGCCRTYASPVGRLPRPDSQIPPTNTSKAPLFWGGGWVGLGWVKASPGRLPTVRAALPCRTRPGGCTRVSGHKAYRTADRPQTPRWRSRAGDAAVPVCMCPCVFVEGGGGGLWHTCLLHCCSALAHMVRGSVCLVLQAPAGRLESLTLSPPGEMWAWARNLHVTRTCYPTTPRLPVGTGRRWYVARLGSDPHSLTALGTGGAATRAGSGSPRPRAYRGAGGGSPGRKECFPALGATGAGCTGCGATARVDEGAQRAPHPNGLSVVLGGGGGQSQDWAPPPYWWCLVPPGNGWYWVPPSTTIGADAQGGSVCDAPIRSTKSIVLTQIHHLPAALSAMPQCLVDSSFHCSLSSL